MRIILPILLSKGLQSSVPEVQTLSVDTVARLAKAAGPAVLQPVLPDLVIQMLESLSALESAKLNYIEQHVEGLGLDAEKLENLRLSAAKSTPMGDTLDLCATYVNSSTLPALLPRVVEMVKRGTNRRSCFMCSNHKSHETALLLPWNWRASSTGSKLAGAFWAGVLLVLAVLLVLWVNAVVKQVAASREAIHALLRCSKGSRQGKSIFCCFAQFYLSASKLGNARFSQSRADLALAWIVPLTQPPRTSFD